MSPPALPEPKTILKDGESKEVKSMSSSTTYTIKRTTATQYFCSCPAWRNQSSPVDARTCKHLREALGEEFEAARLGPLAPTSKSKSKSTAGAGKRALSASATNGAPAKKKGKSKKEEEGEDEEEDGVDSPDASAATKKKKKEVNVLLANKFELGNDKVDPTGWWVSEKLDGIRCFWDGQNTLWSRLGNPFYAPAWFIRKLPKGHTLDGELYHSRGNFSEVSSIVRAQGSDRWNEIRYQVFDIPSLAHLTFEARLKELAVLFPTSPAAPTNHAPSPSSSVPAGVVDQDVEKGKGKEKGKDKDADKGNYKWVKGPVVDLVVQEPCKGYDHLIELLQEVEKGGGEGLMLRKPGSLYEAKRSSTLLKVKTFFDAEATVIGYEPGKGKYKGMTGSLLCQMESGKKFSCGSGLTDQQRRDPPKIGAIISYRFQEITKENVPRFPTFVGERVDVKGPKDADIARKGGPTSGSKKHGGDGSDLD
ncbi:DNA ligase/mRNA capping enzyme [Meredithblackwellia eburnea MCA 4105]